MVPDEGKPLESQEFDEIMKSHFDEPHMNMQEIDEDPQIIDVEEMIIEDEPMDSYSELSIDHDQPIFKRKKRQKTRDKQIGELESILAM